MNIKEIREQYLENLATICESLFDKIDRYFILSYNEILKYSTFSINVHRVYSDYDSSIYFDDAIIKTQQYYSENWNVTFNKKLKTFYFSYKNSGDLTEVLQNPKEIKAVVETKIKVEVEEPEEENRYKLMDMEE